MASVDECWYEKKRGSNPFRPFEAFKAMLETVPVHCGKPPCKDQKEGKGARRPVSDSTHSDSDRETDERLFSQAMESVTPIEKLSVGKWRKWVMAYTSAERYNGGTGATYVLLRRQPVPRRVRKNTRFCSL